MTDTNNENSKKKDEPVDIDKLRAELAEDIDSLIYQVNPVNRFKDASKNQRLVFFASVAVVTAGIILAVLYKKK